MAILGNPWEDLVLSLVPCSMRQFYSCVSISSGQIDRYTVSLAAKSTITAWPCNEIRFDFGYLQVVSIMMELMPLRDFNKWSNACWREKGFAIQHLFFKRRF